MLTWVVYDIANDRTRTRIARRCLDFGLYRVQKSVFLGDVEPNRLDEIELFSKEELDEDNDSVYIFPLCKEDFDKVGTRTSVCSGSWATWSRMLTCQTASASGGP